ncbi:MAG: DNA polymerase IV [Saprospiraceae bacterium]
MRKIIHIDMDAFYASVEQRDNPALRGKPIAVGGGGNRGVITTASYEARKYGIRSAMPGFKARLLCPDLIFVPVRFDAYKEASQQIRTVFRSYTDLIEPLSFDEAYLDVTDNKINEPIATIVANKIRTDILKLTQLTCSAGVSYCKFIAKIASDINKPDGICIIRPHQAERFLEELPIRKFYGVGKVTAAKMESVGIRYGADLKKWSKIDLTEKFGKPGAFYFDIVRGIDDRPVVTSRVRKSLAVERTLEKDLSTIEEITPHLYIILEKFYKRLKKTNSYGRTITLKLKTHDFKILTRRKSKAHVIKDDEEIKTIAFKLLKDNQNNFKKIRLIGLTSSNFDDKKHTDQDGQLTLF